MKCATACGGSRRSRLTCPYFWLLCSGVVVSVATFIEMFA